MKTRIFSFIIIIAMLIPTVMFASCGNKATYSANVPVADLSAIVDELLPNPSDFATMTDDYIIGMMEIDPTEFADHAVKLRASGSNIDEYGIFKAPTSSDVADVEATVKAYLAKRVEAWMPEYMPEEFPKMEAASVKVMGQYVIYAILSEDAKTDVFAAITDKLLQK